MKPESPGARAWVGAALYSPALLALVIMIPRLASPQFGLLDDGGMLKVSLAINAGELPFHDLGDGRFRPVYWLWWGLLYRLAGLHPLGYFIAVAIVFSVSVAAIITLVRRLGGTVRQAWLTGMLLAVSGPAIENHYTLSKAEPLQLLLMLVVLLLASRVSRDRCSQAGHGVAIGVLTLISAACKETTLLLAPVAVAWWALAWWRQRAEPSRDSLHAWQALGMGAVLGSGVYVVLRQVSIGQALVGFGYAERYVVDASRIFSSAVRWGAWLIHDFAYQFPLLAGLVLLGPSAWRRVRPWLETTLVWFVAWLVFFLPWQFVADYYLLPFAAGSATLAAGCAEVLLAEMGAARFRRALAGLSLGLGALLLPASLANTFTMARLQLTVDAANADALAYMAAATPEEAAIRVNIQQPSEYLDEIAAHLEVVYGRADVKVAVLDLELPDRDSSGPAIIADPFIRNQVLLSPRIGIYERFQEEANWTLDARLDGRRPVHTIERSMRAASVDPARLACPLILAVGTGLGVQAEGVWGSIGRYCANAPAIDTRQVAYGWRFYTMPSAK